MDEPTSSLLVSCVVPVYNEEKNIVPFYERMQAVMASLSSRWEIVFVNDGSTDRSAETLAALAAKDSRVTVVEFTRNFGKEMATTAGLQTAGGDACVILDADLQHPPELIPEFVRAWEAGAEVVVGVWQHHRNIGLLKHWGAGIFYALMQRIADTPLLPYATDFRLLSRPVIDAFNRLTEHSRITRGLIDWLGFRTVYVPFVADRRHGGASNYSLGKLSHLALLALVSHSLFPLKIAGYLGVCITLFSAPLGFFIFVEKYVLDDRWGFDFTGTAMLAVFILFLIGIVLMCLGLMAFYIAAIRSDVANRPMYVVRRVLSQDKAMPSPPDGRA